MKWRLSAIVLICSLACSGCFTIMALVLQPVSNAELVRKYGPPDARWIGTPVIPDTLLLLSAEDPSLHGGRIVPSSLSPEKGHFDRLPDTQWLNIEGVRSFRIYIEPTLERNWVEIAGPKKGEPTGVYEFSYQPWDERCGLQSPSGLSGKRCITYRYLGPLDLNREKYVFVVFVDASWKNATVFELRDNTNTVLARAVSCVEKYGERLIAGCKRDNDLRSLLKAESVSTTTP